MDMTFSDEQRALQDNVRRLQGEVKQHDGAPTASVARLDPSGDYGFLETGDGREIYFHRNSVLDPGFARLAVGARVFEISGKAPAQVAKGITFRGQLLEILPREPVE